LLLREVVPPSLHGVGHEAVQTSSFVVFAGQRQSALAWATSKQSPAHARPGMLVHPERIHEIRRQHRSDCARNVVLTRACQGGRRREWAAQVSVPTSATATGLNDGLSRLLLVRFHRRLSPPSPVLLQWMLHRRAGDRALRLRDCRAVPRRSADDALSACCGA
jgi:hypothetical protein